MARNEREADQDSWETESESSIGPPLEAFEGYEGKQRLDCDEDCPLRKPYFPTRGPALPPAPVSLPQTREEASKLLYGNIREWQTRLLLLESGPLDADLTAQLVVANITHQERLVLHEADESVEYQALSYAWGAPVFPRLITIDRIEVPITENLFAFLCRFRRPDSHCYLWIDAICINQLDLAEKAMQIGNMFTIYQKAKEVVVWLGDYGEHSRLAIEYLRWRYNVRKSFTNPWQQDFTEDCHHHNCTEIIRSLISGVEDICGRNWIRRLWVKQEFRAARKTIIHCGCEKITWDELAPGPLMRLLCSDDKSQDKGEKADFMFRPSLSEEQWTCFATLGAAKFRLAESSFTTHNTPSRIVTLLNESCANRCTEPLDRVYALMNLAGIKQPASPADAQSEDASTQCLQVDYTISLRILFLRLARKLLYYYGPLIFLYAHGVFGKRSALNLPSWAPDFQSLLEYPRDFMDAWRDPSTRSSTSGYLRQSGKMHMQQVTRFRESNSDLQSERLTVWGHRIATLTDTGSLSRDVKHTLRGGVLSGIISKEIMCGVAYCYPPVAVDLLKARYKFMNCVTTSITRSPHKQLKNFNKCMKRLGGFVVPQYAQTGDHCILVEPIGMPLILRSSCDRQTFEFVGGACVPGTEATLHSLFGSGRDKLDELGVMCAFDDMMVGAKARLDKLQNVEAFLLE